MSYSYSAKELRRLEEFRQVLTKTTGLYCTLEISDPLVYVWSGDKRIGRISTAYSMPTFVPASR